MSSEERILRLENAMATLAELSADNQRRTARLDESFVTLVELTRSHSEGMDELRAAQADTERKMGALIDAHLRTEDALARLTLKVDDLTDFVQGGRNGQSGN